MKWNILEIGLVALLDCMLGFDILIHRTQENVIFGQISYVIPKKDFLVLIELSKQL